MQTSPRPLTLADILEAMADGVGDRVAITTMEGDHTYARLDERSTRLANHLVGLGVRPGDRVAIHSANRIEWIEGFYACLKTRALPVNINYKYQHDELRYLYGNAECVASIVAPEHLAAVEALGDLTPPHRVVLDDTYEEVIASGSTDRLGGRSADDLYVLYTGGTTGSPKGVLWRQQDLIRAALNSARFGVPVETVEGLVADAQALDSPLTLLACGPMMHGGSQWIMGNGHVSGQRVALFTQPNFSAEAILDLVAKSGVNSLTFLGDAMGRPVAEAILAEPDRWDLSSLVAVSNGAAPLSEGVRGEIRRALPGRFILDVYGASESGATASHIDDGTDGALGAPRFDAGPDIEVFDDQGQPCGVGVEGWLARSGPIPLGYLNDPEKTAQTFREIDGVRWSIPGDAARREVDGSVSVLGRGSTCINTGGEKVHPEEVEAVLLRHDDVFDAAVVGTPHERWGQQVTALVQIRVAGELSEQDVRDHARSLISNYKVPKRVFFVDRIPRTSVSKVDYRASVDLALQLLV